MCASLSLVGGRSRKMTSTDLDLLPLASALVRLSRERGVPVERLRAEQLLRDARTAWPGESADGWDKWLREAGESVGLRCRVADLSVEEAVRLAAAGALLVGGHQGDSRVITLLKCTRSLSHAHVATDELDGVHRVTVAGLAEQLADTPGGAEMSRWLVVDLPKLTDSDEANLAHKPVRRYWNLLRPEKSDMGIILVFAFVAGVLSLATPIAVESLVDTVAFGQLLQPVVILAVLLFGFLAFAGAMQAIQTFIVEMIQRRLFARVSADLAFRLPRTAGGAAGAAYGPELINRFLDVATLQKATATLLTDGISIVLATIVGMTVLAFYSPWLLGFDLVLLVVVIAGLYLLGRGAIKAAIMESKLKYKLTAWYEDIMRCQNGFKSSGGAAFANDRASVLTSQYLGYRQKHFGVFFRQIIFVLMLQAIAGTILLGVGGWLVIQGDMTIGQLVAAELIVATILGSLAKLGKHLESFYDVVAAVDKLGVLFDLPVERLDGVLTLPPGDGVRIELLNIKHPKGGPTLGKGFDAEIRAGERVAVLGGSGSGKSTLLRMLYGVDKPSTGHIEIEDTDPRDLRPDVLRDHVGMAAQIELFEGTIADNVHFHRPGLTSGDVRTALFEVGLLDYVLELPQGLDTPINASGGVLCRSHQELLMIARAIACRPRLILIDGLLDSLPDDELRLVIDSLNDPARTWTLIVATGRLDVANLLERILPLGNDNPNRDGAKP